MDDPKDRLVLTPGERSTLHARFCALSGSSRRSLSSVTRQHHRLCTSYRLIVDTNRRSLRAGTPGWFDLSAAEQHELRRVHNKKEKGMTVVNPELFSQLNRVCAGTEAAVTTPSPRPRNTKAKRELTTTTRRRNPLPNRRRRTRTTPRTSCNPRTRGPPGTGRCSWTRGKRPPTSSSSSAMNPTRRSSCPTG